ncbi:MAG: ABC transporter permease [Dehalococcoidia bacterium]
MVAIADNQSALQHVSLRRKPSAWRQALLLARRKALGTVGLVIILFFSCVAIFGPGIEIAGQTVIPGFATQDPNATHLTQKLKPPSAEHWFGTDELGRDVFTRAVYGTRPSIMVGFMASILGVGVGTLIGLVSGYAGRRTDMVIQRVIDGMMAFPPLVLLLTLASVFQPSMRNIVIILILFVAPSSSRVVRGAVLSIKQSPFVEAAQTVGVSGPRIALRHVLPNVFAPVLVLMSIVVGSAILVEASASFLGFGIAPPNSSLGSMLSANLGSAMSDQPWMALAPGIAITLIVLSFNLVGDALRDVLDPRLRGTGR